MTVPEQRRGADGSEPEPPRPESDQSLASTDSTEPATGRTADSAAPGSPRPADSGPGASPDEATEEAPRVVIRDRRRIDPTSGAVRQSTDEAPPAAAAAGAAPAEQPAADAPPSELEAEVATLQAALAERTADLQRVTAEYANYRRRVDRDRVLVGETAQDQLLSGLLPVLDDIDRAREHGDLTGAFKAVADALETALTRTGLEPFGTPGDEFDPNRHEAVMHQPADGEITRPTCVAVMRRGYQRGERVLRPAMVAVAEPEGPAAEVGAAEAGEDAAGGSDLAGDAGDEVVDPVNGTGPRDSETT